MRLKKIFFLSFVLPLSVAVASAGTQTKAPTQAPVPAPTPTPTPAAVTTKTLSDSDWPADLLQGNRPAFGGKQKLFLIDFWASWCEPCRQSIPYYDELQKKWADQGVQFVGVSADEDVADAKKFLSEVKFSFPSFWDKKRKLAEKLGLQAIPVLIVVNSSGKIIATESGFTSKTRHELPAQLKKWLSE